MRALVARILYLQHANPCSARYPARLFGVGRCQLVVRAQTAVSLIIKTVQTCFRLEGSLTGARRSREQARAKRDATLTEPSISEAGR